MKVYGSGGTVEIRENGLYVDTEKPFKFKKPFQGLVPFNKVSPEEIFATVALAVYSDFKKEKSYKVDDLPSVNVYVNRKKKTVYFRILDGDKDAGIAFNNLAAYQLLEFLKEVTKEVSFEDSEGVTWKFKKVGNSIKFSLEDFLGIVHEIAFSDEEKLALKCGLEVFLRSENIKPREPIYVSKRLEIVAFDDYLKIITPVGDIKLTDRMVSRLLSLFNEEIDTNVVVGHGGTIEVYEDRMVVKKRDKSYTVFTEPIVIYEIASSLRRRLFENEALIKAALLSDFPDDFAKRLISGDESLKDKDTNNPLVAGFFALKREKIKCEDFVANIHLFGNGAAIDIEDKASGKDLCSMRLRRGALFVLEAVSKKLIKKVSIKEKEHIVDIERNGNTLIVKEKAKSFTVPEDFIFLIKMSLEQYLRKGEVRPFKLTFGDVRVRMFNIFDNGHPISGIGFEDIKTNNDLVVHLGIKRALKFLALL